MILSLRVRHRRTILLLAIALPLLFVAALSVRRPIPRMERLPDGLAGDRAGAPAVGAPRVVSWEGGSLQVKRFAGESGPAVSIELLQELTRPGLLVYWSAGGGTDAVEIPGGAVLLGSLSGRFPVVLPLPPESGSTDGRLMLTSPTQNEVVIGFRLPAASSGEAAFE